MSEPLLNQALSLLALKGRQQQCDRAGWRARVNALREFLVSLDEPQRRALFEFAGERPVPPRYKGVVEQMQFWFFQHPSFEVFEAFRQDDPVCASFADYLDQVRYLADKTFFRLPSIKRMWNQQPKDESGLLPERYAQILGRYFFAFAHKNKHRYLITPTPQVTELMKRFAVAQGKQEVCRKAIADLKEQIGIPPNIESYERIFDDLPPTTDMKLPTINEIVPVFEVGEFIPDVSFQWMKMPTAHAAVRSAMGDMSWATFRPTAMSLKKVRCGDIRFELNQPLLDQIGNEYAQWAEAVRRIRQTEDGRLSIGLKVHYVKQSPLRGVILSPGFFIAHSEKMNASFVLPPVGSVGAVDEMLLAIERRTGVSFVKNPDYQIQVCCPGKLSARNAALLGISFYLGSDSLRTYERGSFVTSHPDVTGNRLIIYGAGILDTRFEWWGVDAQGELKVGKLPVGVDCTDVLSCESLLDIDNVNLVATLLVHMQYGGYWAELGKRFAQELEAMLMRHQLTGLLEVGWVKENPWPSVRKGHEQQDGRFFDALEELMNYARDEAERISRARGRGEQVTTGILFEMQDLLERYRSELRERARAATKGKKR